MEALAKVFLSDSDGHNSDSEELPAKQASSAAPESVPDADSGTPGSARPGGGPTAHAALSSDPPPRSPESVESLRDNARKRKFVKLKGSAQNPSLALPTEEDTFTDRYLPQEQAVSQGEKFLSSQKEVSPWGAGETRLFERTSFEKQIPTKRVLLQPGSFGVKPCLRQEVTTPLRTGAIPTARQGFLAPSDVSDSRQSQQRDRYQPPCGHDTRSSDWYRSFQAIGIESDTDRFADRSSLSGRSWLSRVRSHAQACSIGFGISILGCDCGFFEFVYKSVDQLGAPPCPGLRIVW